MPIYVFVCPSCNKRIEFKCKISDFGKVECSCGVEMKSELQPVNFAINGYNADNGYSKKEI